jgi:uncharacterized OB-fold protein
VYSFTISYYKWIEALPPPYVVAEIELAEQPGLLLTSNTIGVDPDDVEIGMAVEVCFIPNGDVFIPQFRPAGGHGR